MNIQTTLNEESYSVPVNRATVDSITIYDVTESELNEIESSSAVDWLLNVTIACTTTMVSFVVTLTTTTINNLRLFCVYVILTFIGGCAAVGFFINWKILKGRRDNVIKQIKERKKDKKMILSGDPTVAEPSQSP